MVAYGIAMAWGEAAVVLYLRTLIGRIDPYQPNPLPVFGGLSRAELVREAATLIMLLAVGALAGRTWRGRLGYSVIAFGVWDIFYYVFLKVLCGWPHSLAAWDILFLLPLPWWGPVWAPMSIALLMIVWGTLAVWSEDHGLAAAGHWSAALATAAGVLIALYTFMADALRVAGRGEDALRNLLPVRFNWPLFCLGLLLMSTPAAHLCWRFRRALMKRSTYEMA